MSFNRFIVGFLVLMLSVVAYAGDPMVIDTPGEYVLTDNVVLANGVEGGGINISVSDVIIDCDGYSITGWNADWPTDTVGIVVYNMSANITNITVENCNIMGFVHGVAMASVSDVLIQSNNFTDDVYPIGINYWIPYTQTWDEPMYFGDNVTISSNRIDNGTGGCYINNVSAVFTQNTVTDSGGLSWDNSTDVLNNSFYNISGQAAFMGTPQLPTDGDINYNNITYAQTGIYISTGNVVGNRILYMQKGGIQASAGNILNNTVWYTDLEAAGYNIAIFAQGANINVSGNNIKNGSLGIGTNHSIPTFNEFSSNTIENFNYGIYIGVSGGGGGPSNNTIFNNTITNNAYGVWMYQYGLDNNFTDNTVTSNTVYDFYCMDTNAQIDGGNTCETVHENCTWFTTCLAPVSDPVYGGPAGSLPTPTPYQVPIITPTPAGASDEPEPSFTKPDEYFIAFILLGGAMGVFFIYEGLQNGKR